MTTAGLRIATLLLGLLGPPSGQTGDAATIAPGDLPRAARVTAATLQTFSAPGEGALGLDHLSRGDLVRVVDADPVSGWLTIEAPTDAFAWVEQTAVRPDGPAAARVSVPRTTLRAGVHGARMLGPPRIEIERGARLRLVDRLPLETGDGPTVKHWLAVAAPEGDVRHVRADGLAWVGSDRPAEKAAAPETQASYEGPAPEGAPDGLASEIQRIEGQHRAAIAGPVEAWDLGPVRQRYEALLKDVREPEATAAVRARLELVARHEEIARSARTIQTVLERSRRRDRDVAVALQTIDRLNEPGRRPFAAEGLVQRSSRQVEGRRVFALIGPKGVPIAYLDIPPGLDTRRVLARRVGVRGHVGYDESLGTRLIAVRDIEPLD